MQPFPSFMLCHHITYDKQEKFDFTTVNMPINLMFKINFFDVFPIHIFAYTIDTE